MEIEDKREVRHDPRSRLGQLQVRIHEDDKTKFKELVEDEVYTMSDVVHTLVQAYIKDKKRVEIFLGEIEDE